MIEGKTSTFNSIDVDYDHRNALGFVLSSDDSTANRLGYPMPCEFGGRGINQARIREKADIYFMQLSKWCDRGLIEINGLRINTVIVKEGISCKVRFMNCWINKVILLPRTTGQNPTLYFISTRISELVIRPHSCRDMFLTDSYVRRVRCGPPELGNPFTGSLILSGDVQLAGVLQEEDIQDYRNLRYNLSERKNAWPVYVIRAIELSRERQYYKNKLMEIINYLYDVSSGFGNVPEKALALTTALLVYNVMLIWLNKLYAIAMDCVDVVPSSWLVTLCHTNGWSSLVASMLLAFRGFLNPILDFLGNGRGDAEHRRACGLVVA
jgi:hypothetical protein